MKQSDNHNNQIEALLANLKREFIAELPTRFQEMEELILGLSTNNNYAEIYRNVHSLKGSGGTHGIEILSFACHQLEEELERLHKDNSITKTSSINILLEYLDLLKSIQEAELDKKDNSKEVRDHLKLLRDKTVGEAIEVLIIEPSKSFSVLLSQILSELSVNITVTDNGIKGLQLLLNRTFQVVISAFETRSLNGLAVIAAAKSQRRYQKLGLTTIVISSNAPEFEASSLAPDYCLKRNEKLDETLAKIIQQKINRKN
jgi:chemotaxis protein histidine kinase CheA